MVSILWRWASMLLVAVACGGPTEPPLARLEPVLRGDLDYVVAPLRHEAGFSLTISPSDAFGGERQARVSVYAVDGEPIPYHLFDCHDTKKRSLDRSPAVTITPGTVRFCSIFVRSPERVHRIVLDAEGHAPMDVYRKGDPLGPAPLSTVTPPEIEYRLPDTAR